VYVEMIRCKKPDRVLRFLTPNHDDRILRWCFPFADVLSVCTDVEFDVCGICVRLSTFSESLLGQNK